MHRPISGKEDGGSLCTQRTNTVRCTANRTESVTLEETMSHRTHTAIAHRTHRAQIGRASMFGGLLLLVGLIVTFLAATGTVKRFCSSGNESI